MTHSLLSLLVLVPLMAAEADSDSQVDSLLSVNPVYKGLVDDGLEIDGERFKFPLPLLREGQTAETQQQQLRGLLETDRKLAEFLRDSVSAPFILKLNDKSTDNFIVRRADLWFAIHASLDSVDLDSMTRQAADAKPVEVGNMRFESRLLGNDELKSRSIELQKSDASGSPTLLSKTFYIHQTGRLLDRIHVEGTDQVMATRVPDALLIASRTDRRFDGDKTAANQWWPLVGLVGKEVPGSEPKAYPGGASYVVIHRLASDPKILVAEAHITFAEPRPWFDGAPILRSKLSLIAQDQIRKLRREVVSRKGRPQPEK